MRDEDMVNTTNREDWGQQREEKEVKNRILSMANVERKQKEWARYFQPMTLPDDSYLAGNVY